MWWGDHLFVRVAICNSKSIQAAYSLFKLQLLSKALWAGQTEGEGLKISDLVFSFLNVPTGCGHDL